MLGFDCVTELLSSLLKLLLRGSRWNGIGLSSRLVEKRSSNTNSSLVLDLDVDWAWLAISSVCSVHCVVHYASLVNLSSLDEGSIA